MGLNTYTNKIDMWSLGCILVELYTGKPLFPSKSQKELLISIIQVIGSPPEEMVTSCTKDYFSDEDIRNT